MLASLDKFDVLGPERARPGKGAFFFL